MSGEWWAILENTQSFPRLRMSERKQRRIVLPKLNHAKYQEYALFIWGNAQTWRGPNPNPYPKPQSIICSLEECYNKLVVSAYHLVEHTMLGLWSPGVGIFFFR